MKSSAQPQTEVKVFILCNIDWPSSHCYIVITQRPQNRRKTVCCAGLSSCIESTPVVRVTKKVTFASPELSPFVPRFDLSTFNKHLQNVQVISHIIFDHCLFVVVFFLFVCLFDRLIELPLSFTWPVLPKGSCLKGTCFFHSNNDEHTNSRLLGRLKRVRRSF